MPLPPEPVEFAAWTCYSKDDVFGLCDVLARAEQVLIQAGEPHEAAQVAAAFDLLEGGLASGRRRRLSRSKVRTRSTGS